MVLCKGGVGAMFEDVGMGDLGEPDMHAIGGRVGLRKRDVLIEEVLDSLGEGPWGNALVVLKVVPWENMQVV